MFNQFSNRRPFTPSNQPQRRPAQPPQPSRQGNSQFSAQIRPGFMQPVSQPTTGTTGGFNRPSRIKPDEFQSMGPQHQRAALYEQARQQSFQQAYQPHHTLNAALPGGLSKQQIADFRMLERTNPLAAQAQLQNYQRNADIRYNKPTAQPPQSPGLTYRRPPSNFQGPRRSF